VQVKQRILEAEVGPGELGLVVHCWSRKGMVQSVGKWSDVVQVGEGD